MKPYKKPMNTLRKHMKPIKTYEDLTKTHETYKNRHNPDASQD